jgi:hypothetical protein
LGGPIIAEEKFFSSYLLKILNFCRAEYRQIFLEMGFTGNGWNCQFIVLNLESAFQMLIRILAIGNNVAPKGY